MAVPELSVLAGGVCPSVGAFVLDVGAFVLDVGAFAPGAPELKVCPPAPFCKLPAMPMLVSFVGSYQNSQSE